MIVGDRQSELTLVWLSFLDLQIVRPTRPNSSHESVAILTMPKSITVNLPGTCPPGPLGVDLTTSRRRIISARTQPTKAATRTRTFPGGAAEGCRTAFRLEMLQRFHHRLFCFFWRVSLQAIILNGPTHVCLEANTTTVAERPPRSELQSQGKKSGSVAHKTATVYVSER